MRRPVRCNRRKHPNKTMGGFAVCICKAVLIFIGLERMGNVYFVAFQAQNGPPARGGENAIRRFSQGPVLPGRDSPGNGSTLLLIQ